MCVWVFRKKNKLSFTVRVGFEIQFVTHIDLVHSNLISLQSSSHTLSHDNIPVTLFLQYIVTQWALSYINQSNTSQGMTPKPMRGFLCIKT